MFLLSGKVVVLSISKTFKRIDSAIPHKITFFPQKYCGVEYLCYHESLLILFSPTLLSVQVTLPVTDLEIPLHYSSASKDPMLQVETAISNIYF